MRVSPHGILLATDLSARSDRAQDRAMLLMKQYGSELVVLHVLEPTQKNRTSHRVRFRRPSGPMKNLSKTQGGRSATPSMASEIKSWYG